MTSINRRKLFAYLYEQQRRVNAEYDELNAEYMPLLFDVPGDDPRRRELLAAINRTVGKNAMLCEIIDFVLARRDAE